MFIELNSTDWGNLHIKYSERVYLEKRVSKYVLGTGFDLHHYHNKNYGILRHI